MINSDVYIIILLPHCIILFVTCNREMMNQFVTDLTELWTDVGLELKPRTHLIDELTTSSGIKVEKSNALRFCPQGGETCEYCKKPVLFEKLEAREKIQPSEMIDNVMVRRVAQHCHKPNCPQMATSTA